MNPRTLTLATVLAFSQLALLADDLSRHVEIQASKLKIEEREYDRIERMPQVPAAVKTALRASLDNRQRILVAIRMCRIERDLSRAWRKEKMEKLDREKEFWKAKLDRIGKQKRKPVEMMSEAEGIAEMLRIRAAREARRPWNRAKSQVPSAF